MKCMSRGIALMSLCLSLAACGTSKFYTLPVDAYRATETQTMIGACATDYGLESNKGDNGIVTVKYDETASLYYHYNDSDAFNMQVVVDEKRVPGSELEKKFAAVKLKGDDIYACAQMKLNNPQAAIAPVAPAQSGVSIQMNTGMDTGMNVNMNTNMNTGMSMSVTTSTSTSASTNASASASASVSTRGGYCAQAIDCYGQLAKTVCEGAKDCSFKVKISGNDEDSCHDALLRVPQLLQPFTMMRPGLSAPAVCQTE
ncbi:hypothetical protein [Vitiosangium sp. GDMCC 1.1324]|uniref:hypothetical protein n=1 Tax=Vitiosangium sp. (strain GDMCC 1.1324) TaxID=2138576 RepID=UPI000D3CA5E3|nr:hypothetical protein [Vitiosangium sp. GDMCC 1.1324]PTL84263.1 hypothetical protein DAT35_12615 [Vitiosangium sp. GDMCC 1.1324]